MPDNQSTEHKILEAAKQIFIEKGLKSATMADIARKANISRTSLNYYYRTKENLFYAIIEQVFDTLLPRIENLTITEGGVEAKIDKIVDIYDDMLRKNQYIPRFAFVEIQRNPRLIHDFVAQNPKAQLYLSSLELLLTKGEDNDKIRKINKSHLISTFFGLLFVPYLLEPLLAMYRTSDEKRIEFLDEHKIIVKKLMRTYFE